MKTSPAKQKVMDAASTLFFQKGFSGTSVRDIATKAMVNVSLISYYFKSKQGLLEHSITKYYEVYLEKIEATLKTYQDQPTITCLKKLIETIVQYKQENYQFSCFVVRELSLDSVFVREMLVTYLAKERYYIQSIFYPVLDTSKYKRVNYDLLYMQLKGMLNTPYISQHDWRTQAMDKTAHHQFASQYSQIIYDWIEFLVC